VNGESGTEPPAGVLPMEKGRGIGAVFVRGGTPRRWAAGAGSLSGSPFPPSRMDTRRWEQEVAGTVLCPRPVNGEDLGEPKRAGMVDLHVRDLAAPVTQPRAAKVEGTVDPDADPNGRFARSRDPGGNPIELGPPMEPAAAPSGDRPRPANDYLGGPDTRRAMDPPNKFLVALRYVGVVALLLVIVQYLLGLGTNVYGPATGFTENSSNPWLNAHYTNGDVLFLVSVVSIVLAALSRVWRLLGPSVALTVSVLLAGLFGMAYVGTTPNPPIDSYAMGVMFLFALGSAFGLIRMSWPGGAPWMRAMPGASPNTP
jgi:glyoxylase I family protein